MRRLILSTLAAMALSAPAVAQAPAKPATLYRFEQLISPKLTPELLEKVKPLNTLAEIESLLKANDVPFGWRKAEVDASNLDPAVVDQIEALPPKEVFVAPQGETYVYSVVLSKRPKPAS